MQKKTWKLILHAFPHIPYLSCEFERVCWSFLGTAPKKYIFPDFDACDFRHAKDWRDFCEPDSDVNQLRVGSSTQKHAGSRGTALLRGVGDKGPHHLFSQMDRSMDNFFFHNFKSVQIYMKYAECAETNEK